MKKCSKCFTEKSLDNFHEYKSGRRKGTYWAHCKDCRKEHLYKWRKENPDKYKDHYSRAQYKYKYNVDKDLRDSFTTKPCMICGRLAKRYAVDHCHSTGQVRGVICLNCNTVLGHIENEDKMAHIGKYLRMELPEQKPFIGIKVPEFKE